MARKPMAWIVSILAAVLVLAAAVPAGATGEPLDITTAALAVGEVDASYSQTLAASGGVAPYTWSLVAGSLPAGLTLNASTGVIAGTPTGAGDSAFTVEVVDAETTATTQALSIAVASAVAVGTSTLPDGTLNAAYSQALTVSGGVAPYVWSLASGTLPVGLTLNAASGTIAGTSTATGTSTFTVRVTDDIGSQATQALTLTIAAAATTLTITTLELPKASVGFAYSQSLNATGGVAPLTWSLVAGSLPAGLSLNSGTGVIAGTPTAAGMAVFAVKVTDTASASTARILFMNVKNSDTTTDKPKRDKNAEFEDRVYVACDVSIDAHPAMGTLCSLYMGDKLGGVARPIIGRVILKLADRAELKQSKDERTDHEREIRAKAKSDAKLGKDIAHEIRAEAKADAKSRKDVTKTVKKLNTHADFGSAVANSTMSLDHDDDEFDHEDHEVEHDEDGEHDENDEDDEHDEHETEDDD
ncbi:MAG: putative Ig domain-containing protein [Chloroflexi bacterium]|nr:putative Ig domain-containing protein [Chloroflexota bacterium]